jgi:hypothetical protein
MDQWDKIALGEDWKTGAEVEDIHCTDGDFYGAIWRF